MLAQNYQVHRAVQASGKREKALSSTAPGPRHARRAVESPARRRTNRIIASRSDVDGNLLLGKNDLLALLNALEAERTHATPWQMSSLRHSLEMLAGINEARPKRGRA